MFLFYQIIYRSINRKLSTARLLFAYSLYLPSHHKAKPSILFVHLLIECVYVWLIICVRYHLLILLSLNYFNTNNNFHTQQTLYYILYSTRIYLLNFAHNGTLNILNTNTRVSVIDGIM